MAKANALVTSGPSNPQHVSGISIMGSNQPSMVHGSFSTAVLEPDEVPSHTYVATGRMELHKRSRTIAVTLPPPNLVLRKLSRLRSKSISYTSEAQDHADDHAKSSPAMAGSDRVRRPEGTRHIRMKSSLSRLRQTVGLDRGLHESTVDPKLFAAELAVAEPETALTPLEKDLPPIPAQISSQPPSKSLVHVTTWTAKPRVRPKRADSGTAIAFDDVAEPERPLPFQTILATEGFDERMAMYKKTRDYWAYADHGLVEWTVRAGGPKSRPRRII
ncbi:hypothetical protein ACEQ8H_001181 [Pleosporales sp. CAS-2024a]